jgi:hypothetical protein
MWPLLEHLREHYAPMVLESDILTKLSRFQDCVQSMLSHFFSHCPNAGIHWHFSTTQEDARLKINNWCPRVSWARCASTRGRWDASEVFENVCNAIRELMPCLFVGREGERACF